MRVLLKLSGEAFGNEYSSIDANKIQKYIKEIKEAIETDKDSKIGIVVGGGNFFRGRDSKEFNIERSRLDYMGMLGTVMNAVFLEEKLNQAGVKAKAFSMLPVQDVLENYNIEKMNSYMNDGYVCIFGGGTGKPFFSTDTASLNRAVDMNASLVLMAKNGVDGVYSSDPKIDKNAVKYDILSHRDILDKKLNVMDLDAAKIAFENNIDILVFDIDKENAIKDAILGNGQGTIIKKEI